MDFETEYALEEYRKEEKELFDEEGNPYTDNRISFRQMKIMRDLINMLVREIKQRELSIPGKEELIMTGMFLCPDCRSRLRFEVRQNEAGTSQYIKKEGKI
uniref:Uncharacterized protein n=1 Tax=viral metagenome TaxID=1070528 RepID=A0A6H1Z8Y9_9ZZZZ